MTKRNETLTVKMDFALKNEGKKVGMNMIVNGHVIKADALIEALKIVISDINGMITDIAKTKNIEKYGKINKPFNADITLAQTIEEVDDGVVVGVKGAIKLAKCSDAAETLGRLTNVIEGIETLIETLIEELENSNEEPNTEDAKAEEDKTEKAETEEPKKLKKLRKKLTKAHKALGELDENRFTQLVSLCGIAQVLKKMMGDDEVVLKELDPDDKEQLKGENELCEAVNYAIEHRIDASELLTMAEEVAGA